MLPTKVYTPRQFLYTEGSPAREMYIIINGSVKIVKDYKNNPTVIATIGKGSFLGEVALFMNDMHSATAVAETDLKVAVINKDTFDLQVSLLPDWFQSIIRSMADRLQDSYVKTDESVSTEFKKDVPSSSGGDDQVEKENSD